jgi:hypothetical protein
VIVNSRYENTVKTIYPRLYEKIVQSGVNLDINDRWEKGIEHHEKSVELARLIDATDMLCLDNYFYLKFGGDGDNGEFLLYILDIIFEMESKE